MSYSNNVMEVRRQTHGKGQLETMTCLSNDYGFAVMSCVVLGEKEAMVIDTQWSRSNALRVCAEIIETGRKLTTIVISHAHPDHYWGTEVFLESFPDAKVYAMPYDIEIIDREISGKMDAWIGAPGVKTFDNLPRNKKIPMIPLHDDSLYIEGKEVRIFKYVWGDYKWNTMVWIPSIKTLYGSDILFSNAHPFTCEVSAKGRAKWIKDLDRFAEFDYEVCIPGHAKWGEPFDGRSIKFTRDYLVATEEELAKCDTEGEFYYRMSERFIDALLLRSNEMNAQVFKGGKQWYFSDSEDDPNDPYLGMTDEEMAEVFASTNETLEGMPY